MQPRVARTARGEWRAMLAALVVLSVVATVRAQDSDRLANDLPVPINDAKAVEAGRERFGERCAFCHGGGGKGAKGPCLTCGQFKYGGRASQLYGAIAGGIWGTQMGAFDTSLSREEILNIIAFIRVHTEARRSAGEIE